MHLTIATPSPFARKIRIVIREKNITCCESVENPWDIDTTISKLNPLGQVPVLTTDEGEVLFDSRVIFDYLEQKVPNKPLLPSAADDQIYTRKIEAIADGMSNAVILIVLESRRLERLQSIDWIKRQEKKLKKSLCFLDTQLRDEGWFVGRNMTLADVSVGCALSYLDLRLPHFSWEKSYPSLHTFSTLIERRPSFKDTLLVIQEITPVQ